MLSIGTTQADTPTAPNWGVVRIIQGVNYLASILVLWTLFKNSVHYHHTRCKIRNFQKSAIVLIGRTDPFLGSMGSCTFLSSWSVLFHLTIPNSIFIEVWKGIPPSDVPRWYPYSPKLRAGNDCPRHPLLCLETSFVDFSKIKKISTSIRFEMYQLNCSRELKCLTNYWQPQLTICLLNNWFKTYHSIFSYSVWVLSVLLWFSLLTDG